MPDRGVRPTSERTREAVFDILGPARVQGARVLDLYAGTGALGLESLSRGAARVAFAERNGAVAARLEENVRTLGLEARARVHVLDLDRGSLPAALGGPFDLVFLDPPYAGGAGTRWVERIARGGLLAEGGILVYERRKGTEGPRPAALTLATERTYGDTTVAFYRAGGPTGPAGEGEA